jgi:hypothetical protein
MILTSSIGDNGLGSVETGRRLRWWGTGWGTNPNGAQPIWAKHDFAETA